MNEDRLWELYKICLEARKQFGAINGDGIAVEDLAMADAKRAYDRFTLERANIQAAQEKNRHTETEVIKVSAQSRGL